MVRFRRPVAAFTVALAAVVPAPATAGEGPGRAGDTARLLATVPLPPGAQMTEVADHTRAYRVPVGGTQLLAFFRTALPNAGWTERTAARSSDRTVGSRRVDGAEPNADDAGVDPDRNRAAGDRIRAVFTRSGVRLTIVVRELAPTDLQSHPNPELAVDHSDVRLRARSR